MPPGRRQRPASAITSPGLGSCCRAFHMITAPSVPSANGSVSALPRTATSPGMAARHCRSRGLLMSRPITRLVPTVSQMTRVHFPAPHATSATVPVTDRRRVCKYVRSQSSVSALPSQFPPMIWKNDGREWVSYRAAITGSWSRRGAWPTLTGACPAGRKST